MRVRSTEDDASCGGRAGFSCRVAFADEIIAINLGLGLGVMRGERKGFRIIVDGDGMLLRAAELGKEGDLLLLAD